MNQPLVLSYLLAATIALVSAHAAWAQQSSASFASAIANDSTSPSYVLIRVIDDRSGGRQTVCTVAPFLLGAIHDQYHIPYTRRGEEKIETMALAGEDHIYHFSQPDALNNLRPRYTPQILAEVRSRLKNISTQDLVQGLAVNGALHHIYTEQKGFLKYAAYRDALAYVLLERGLSPIQADMTGGLYLRR